MKKLLMQPETDDKKRWVDENSYSVYPRNGTLLYLRESVEIELSRRIPMYTVVYDKDTGELSVWYSIDVIKESWLGIIRDPERFSFYSIEKRIIRDNTPGYADVISGTYEPIDIDTVVDATTAIAYMESNRIDDDISGISLIESLSAFEMDLKDIDCISFSVPLGDNIVKTKQIGAITYKFICMYMFNQSYIANGMVLFKDGSFMRVVDYGCDCRESYSYWELIIPPTRETMMV